MEYVKALMAVQAQGVLVAENVMNCCGSCTGYELAQEFGDTPVAWTFAGQGRELRWDMDDDTPYEWDEGGPKPAVKQYWNFSPLSAGEALAAAFRSRGFTVEWDGNDGKCVTVNYQDE